MISESSAGSHDYREKGAFVVGFSGSQCTNPGSPLVLLTLGHLYDSIVDHALANLAVPVALKLPSLPKRCMEQEACLPSGARSGDTSI